MHELIKVIQELIQVIKKQNLNSKEIVDAHEACEILNLSMSTLNKLTADREIAHYTPGGKKRYFKRVDLQNYMLKNRQLSKDELKRMPVNDYRSH